MASRRPYADMVRTCLGLYPRKCLHYKRLLAVCPQTISLWKRPARRLTGWKHVTAAVSAVNEVSEVSGFSLISYSGISFLSTRAIAVCEES